MGILTIFLSLIGIGFLIKCISTNEFGLTADNICIENRASIFSKIIYCKDIEKIQQDKLSFFFINMAVIKIQTKNSDKPKYISAGLLDITLEELYEKLKLI
jgi:hypothetical protein